MAQHTNVSPITAAERADYAQRSREMAEKMRQEGDLASADLNDWLAVLYSRPRD